MANRRCCVQNFRNNSRKCNCKFYSFPMEKHKISQRLSSKQNKVSNDNLNWVPFIGGIKSDTEISLAICAYYF